MVKLSFFLLIIYKISLYIQVHTYWREEKAKTEILTRNPLSNDDSEVRSSFRNKTSLALTQSAPKVPYDIYVCVCSLYL